MVVAITAVSTVAAAVLSDRSQAERIAVDSAVFTSAQGVLSVSSGLRSNLALAIILASGERAGITVADSSAVAIDLALTNATTLESEARSLDQLVDGQMHTTAAAAASESTRQVLASLADAASAEDAGAADLRAKNETIPLLEAVESLAAGEAGRAQSRIEAERTAAGDAAWASGLLVALIIPALAVTTLWMSSRRRVERMSLRAEIDKNTALVRTRDDLIAGISHQLRTPLTGIVGYADSMLAAPDDVQLRNEGLTTIQAQAGDLTRMIDDLLVMARLEDGPVTVQRLPFDPTSDIELVANAHGASIQTSLAPGMVMGDRLRLRHILTNLISNAVRHGGPAVGIKAGVGDGRYRIVIVDDGAGVPIDLLDNVFRPYVHSARDSLVTGSFGLGLAVAKQLAEQMHCQLTHQRLNGLTMFVLDIPLAPPADPTRITASADQRSFRGAGRIDPAPAARSNGITTSPPSGAIADGRRPRA